jgi:hypothetical protein
MPTNHAEKKEHEISERRVKVTQMLLRGFSQREMAKEVGVCQFTIHTDVKAIEVEWAEERLANTDTLKERHVRRLESVIGEAFVEWERSKKNAIRKESGSNAQGTFDKKVIQGQTGNPVYLSKIVEAAKEIAATTGLHAPVKVAKTDSHGNDIPTEAGANRVSDVVLGILHATPALVAGTSGNGQSVDPPKPDAKTNGVPKSRL